MGVDFVPEFLRKGEERCWHICSGWYNIRSLSSVFQFAHGDRSSKIRIHVVWWLDIQARTSGMMVVVVRR